MRKAVHILKLYTLFFCISLSLFASQPPNEIKEGSCIGVGRKLGLKSFGFEDPGILEILKKGKMKKIEILHIGDSKPLKVSVDNSIYGVFKPKNETDNPANEVAAYTIDKLLGIELVPPTVMRKFDGKTGSLQFFVEEGKNPYETLSNASRNLRFFDLVIANTDRSADNFLVLPNGAQVAIDNMMAFRTLDAPLPHEWVLRQAIPDQLIYERYKSLSAKQWHKSLDSLLGKEKVNQLIKKRDAFVKKVEQWIAEEGVFSIIKSMIPYDDFTPAN